MLQLRCAGRSGAVHDLPVLRVADRDAMQMWTAQAAREREAEAEASARARTIYGPSVLEPRVTPSSLSDFDPISVLAAGSDLVQICLEAFGDF